MPRYSKPVEQSLPEKTLVVDNGAYSIKAGFATSSPNVENDCHIIPNCITRSRDKKIFVGAQLEKCRDFGEMSFRRPVEKGYLVNWEAEKEIWENSFFDKAARLKCDPHETNLLLAEAPNAPAALQTNCDQIVFEEFEFASYYRCIGPSLNAYTNITSLFGDPARDGELGALPAECLLVIDSGYSFTTVTPFFKGRPINQAIRRLEIGGKFLTNYLKELLSIRQYNMLDETYLVDEMKEDVCYVSQDFKKDLEVTWKGSSSFYRKRSRDGQEIVVDYVLPDYTTHLKGFKRPYDPDLVRQNKMSVLSSAGGPTEYSMTLGNERFSVPELLFNPGDIGLKQAGLPETVMQSLSGLPPGLWPAMLANVTVVGGTSKMEGFVDRLRTELRQLAPAECVVRVAQPLDPAKSAWFGGAVLSSDKTALKEVMVTRQQYQEHGSGWLLKKFASGRPS